jgi:hypothetical protein
MNEGDKMKSTMSWQSRVWFRTEGPVSGLTAMNLIAGAVGVDEKKVLMLTPKQVVDLVQAGHFWMMIQNFRWLIIHRLDCDSDLIQAEFYKTVILLEQLNAPASIHLGWLADQNSVMAQLLQVDLHAAVILLQSDDDGSEGMDEWIHQLVDQASAKTGKKVTRISEEVALWLEKGDFTKKDLFWLLCGAFNQMGSETELQLQHFHLLAEAAEMRFMRDIGLAV